ncbi:hypothetical protein PMIN01_10963 [Paraphaeosphaeria minitans]|uniref:Uncharacterized protein n=1 Tax=Paraphaeosphaeria minitans TaxID=565426 RepID=A0A9P6KLM6_9PLEO|nr:hypothetical protein PMIN01_10963 [Paraphaeosphaeria minitans]
MRSLIEKLAPGLLAHQSRLLEYRNSETAGKYRNRKATTLESSLYYTTQQLVLMRFVWLPLA